MIKELVEKERRRIFNEQLKTSKIYSMGMNTIKGLRKTYKRDMARQVKKNDEATQNMLIEAKGRVRDEQEEVID